MSKMTTMKVTTVGLLIGACAVAVAAQTTPQEPTQYINSGLFTVGAGEGVSVHVSLDDRRTAASGKVLLQIFDRNGTAVARQDFTLRPGQSATLQIREPGQYRAHAQTIELPFPYCERRRLIGNAEIFKLLPSTELPDEIREGPVVRVLGIVDDGRGPCSPD